MIVMIARKIELQSNDKRDTIVDVVGIFVHMDLKKLS